MVASFATGNLPQVLAVSPDGSLVYVPNSDDGTVTVLSNNSLLSPISVGGAPLAVIFSPDGAYAYIVNQGTTENYYYVSVIDTATNSVVSVLASSQVPDLSGGIAISPDGTSVYFSGISPTFVGEREIYQAVVGVMDTTNNTMTASILCEKKGKTLPGLTAVTPDGRYLYQAVFLKGHVEDNTVLMIDTTTDAVIGRPIIVGNEPRAVAVAPDGKNAYVANYSDGTVSVLNISQN
ncbi:MAG: YncE family protein [Chthoniobacterales bacterium]